MSLEYVSQPIISFSERFQDHVSNKLALGMVALTATEFLPKDTTEDMVHQTGLTITAGWLVYKGIREQLGMLRDKLSVQTPIIKETLEPEELRDQVKPVVLNPLR